MAKLEAFRSTPAELSTGLERPSQAKAVCEGCPCAAPVADSTGLSALSTRLRADLCAPRGADPAPSSAAGDYVAPIKAPAEEIIANLGCGASLAGA
ncbi:MAG: hypothetical protein ACOYEP_11360, partial [Limnochordia bacterium]